MSLHNINLKKQDLRNKFKYIRESLTMEERAKKDLCIMESLCSLKEYKDANYILSYVSKGSEPDTRSFIEKAFLDGKVVATPRCEKSAIWMDFFIINALEDLEEGSFGVLEPKENNKEKLTKIKDSLCIVPGLVFDNVGSRIGYGSGYYDRYLNSFDGISIGLCYDECFVERLPVLEFDIRVNIVVTESRIIKVK